MVNRTGKKIKDRDIPAALTTALQNTGEIMKIKLKPFEAPMSQCLVLVLAVSLFSLAGCTRSVEELNTMKTAPSAAAPQSSALESQKEKLSYALGMALGNQFREQSIEVDLDRYSQGLRDALSGNPTLLTEKEALTTISVLQRELKRKQASQLVASSALTDIKVIFKLDSRLTRGMYLGDRWVSPPTFTQVGEGQDVTVDAIAQGFDAKGKAVKINPEWTSEDPEMVTVTPGQGDEVKITVQRAGQSTLKVVSSGISADLLIKATGQGNTLLVEISQ